MARVAVWMVVGACATGTPGDVGGSTGDTSVETATAPWAGTRDLSACIDRLDDLGTPLLQPGTTAGLAVGPDGADRFRVDTPADGLLRVVATSAAGDPLPARLEHPASGEDLTGGLGTVTALLPRASRDLVLWVGPVDTCTPYRLEVGATDATCAPSDPADEAVTLPSDGPPILRTLGPGDVDEVTLVVPSRHEVGVSVGGMGAGAVGLDLSLPDGTPAPRTDGRTDADVMPDRPYLAWTNASFDPVALTVRLTADDATCAQVALEASSRIVDGLACTSERACESAACAMVPACVAACPVDPEEPDDRRDLATELADGVVIAGHAAPGRPDLVVVDVPAGASSVVRVDTEPSSPPPTDLVTVVQEQGVRIDPVVVGPAAELMLRVTSTGAGPGRAWLAIEPDDVACLPYTVVAAVGVSPSESDCEDGLDEDGDGTTDCLDPDCQTTPVCAAVCPASDPFEPDSDGVSVATVGDTVRRLGGGDTDRLQWARSAGGTSWIALTPTLPDMQGLGVPMDRERTDRSGRVPELLATSAGTGGTARMETVRRRDSPPTCLAYTVARVQGPPVPTEDCDDGHDDDRDGWTDCADPDCASVCPALCADEPEEPDDTVQNAWTVPPGTHARSVQPGRADVLAAPANATGFTELWVVPTDPQAPIQVARGYRAQVDARPDGSVIATLAEPAFGYPRSVTVRGRTSACTGYTVTRRDPTGPQACSGSEAAEDPDLDRLAGCQDPDCDADPACLPACQADVTEPAQQTLALPLPAAGTARGWLPMGDHSDSFWIDLAPGQFVDLRVEAEADVEVSILVPFALASPTGIGHAESARHFKLGDAAVGGTWRLRLKPPFRPSTAPRCITYALHTAATAPVRETACMDDRDDDDDGFWDCRDADCASDVLCLEVALPVPDDDPLEDAREPDDEPSDPLGPLVDGQTGHACPSDPDLSTVTVPPNSVLLVTLTGTQDERTLEFGAWMDDGTRVTHEIDGSTLVIPNDTDTPRTGVVEVGWTYPDLTGIFLPFPIDSPPSRCYPYALTVDVVPW